MKNTEIKKIRKGVKNSVVMFLRDKPKFLPKWIWRLCAVVIFNDDGLKLVGSFYLDKTITINGIKYRVKG